MAERRRFEISDVSGGMNPDRHPLYIEDNEAADLINFRVDNLGNLTSRQGQEQYGLEAPSGTTILALGRWVGTSRRTNYKVLVALSDGTLVEVDTSETPSSFGTVVHSGLSTTAQGMFLEVEDIVLYANGVDDIIAYDGSQAYPLGITAPSSLAASVGGSGTLTGTFMYAASYVSSTRGWESPATSLASAVSPSAQEVTLTLSASVHPMVDLINIYRTTDGGATLMFLGSISNAGSPSFVDDGTDALSPLVTPVAGAVVPGSDVSKRAQNIAYHKGRLWASVDNMLYWSDPFRLNIFPFFTNTKVPFEGNDNITALKAFQDYLLVFGEMNTILVAGDGGTSGLDIQLIRQDTDIGATSRHAMVEVENQLVFLSARGINVFPGFGEFAPKLTRHICDATEGCRADASMVYVPEERAVWLAITDQTWAIHLPNQGVSRYSFHMRKPLSGGHNAVSAPIWVRALHSSVAPSNAKFLVRYSGHEDFEEPLQAMYKSKIWTVGAPDFMKYWRRIGVFASTGSTLNATVSSPDTLRAYTLDMRPQDVGSISLWDEAEWDVSVFSSEGLGYFLNALPGSRLYGRTMQLEFNSTSSIGIEIHSPIIFTYRATDRFLGR